jgi:hypothetical protein
LASGQPGDDGVQGGDDLFQRRVDRQRLEPVVAQAPEAEEAEEVVLLPFKLDGQTYIRPSSGGNWASGDLWYTEADGSKGSYFGELMDDGSINTDAEEPSFD